MPPEGGRARGARARSVAFLLLLAAIAARPARGQCDGSGGLLLVVDSTADTRDFRGGDGICGVTGGECTLRAAIMETSACRGPDAIGFNLPGPGPHVIVLDEELPDMTDHSGVGLDATTQPGYAGRPIVAIDASAVVAGHALRCTGGHCTIRGLAVYGAGTHGIVLAGSHLSAIEANWIGLDLDGVTPRPNQVNGVFVSGSSLNSIGGNVISGNGADGIQLATGTYGNWISSNRIGTDASGTLAVGNGSRGIALLDAPDNEIGGRAPGGGNVVAGNGFHGILLQGAGAARNVVAGNRVGTDAAGSAPLGNFRGIVVDDAPDNEIGVPGNGNLVASSLDDGIVLTGSGASGNRVVGNSVGVAEGGSDPLPNGGDGIAIEAGASSNRIGGAAAGEGNRAWFSGGSGIRVVAGRGNDLARNSVSANDALGIDLGSDRAVTANDALDADSGANDLQNFPVLASAVGACAETRVEGRLESAPGSTFRLEFYSSPACDGSGSGEGAAWIGEHQGSTDAAGVLDFAALLPVRVSSGESVTATATDAQGNTSELSPCVVASGGCTTCGNGSLDAGEACDEGGVDTPTCDADCSLVACGDFHLNRPAGEECDDGNTLPGDGCSDTCRTEGCLAATLVRLAPIAARKGGGGVQVLWPADPAAAEYHLNSVARKEDLADPRRSPGRGRPECESLPPFTSCVDADAFATPDLILYQAFSSCGAAGSDEGPF